MRTGHVNLQILYKLYYLWVLKVIFLAKNSEGKVINATPVMILKYGIGVWVTASWKMCFDCKIWVVKCRYKAKQEHFCKSLFRESLCKLKIEIQIQEQRLLCKFSSSNTIKCVNGYKYEQSFTDDYYCSFFEDEMWFTAPKRHFQ